MRITYVLIALFVLFASTRFAFAEAPGRDLAFQMIPATVHALQLQTHRPLHKPLP